MPILFVLSAAAILYVLIGYPALLWAFARFRPRPFRRRPLAKTVSLLIPVRDGEAFIRAKLRSVLDLDYPRKLLEIVVASDGSRDGTDRIVREFAAEGVRLLELPRRGKPAALNAAIPVLRGDIVLLTDVRQLLEPLSLRRLVACFDDPAVGVVSGLLSIRGGRDCEECSTGLYWKYETWIRRNLSLRDSLLGATGPFYAIRRSLAAPIPEDVLLDDVYLPMSIVLKGYRSVVAEDAVAYDFPADIRAEFRRKLRTQAGVYQLIWKQPALFMPANRTWFAFWSLKVGRLLLPYWLLLLVISGFGLPDPWHPAAVSVQLSFYALAALDPWVPGKGLLKRVSSACRSFVMLVIAAICGISVFFVQPGTLWKPSAIKAPSGSKAGSAE